MRVGVPLYNLELPFITGISRYTYNLVERLCMFGDVDVFVYTNMFDNFGIFNRFNTKIFFSFRYIPLGSFYSRVIEPLTYMKDQIDIVHNTGSFPRGRIPKTRYKQIITIHDIAAFKYPLLAGPYLVKRFKVLATEANKYDRIITHSFYTKKDLMGYLNIPDEKISVVYPGGKEKSRRIMTKKELSQKYKLPNQYILCVGEPTVLRNTIGLIKIYKILSQKKVKQHLVIVGREGQHIHRVYQVIKQLGLNDKILVLGYVDEEDLSSIYAHADLYAYPSLHEGFGHTVLEAMIHGIPVVASNTTAIPEVVGDGGILVDPQDTEAFAEKIYEVLTDTNLQATLRKKGEERAKLFTWNNMARETLKIYREILYG